MDTNIFNLWGENCLSSGKHFIWRGEIFGMITKSFSIKNWHLPGIGHLQKHTIGEKRQEKYKISMSMRWKIFSMKYRDFQYYKQINIIRICSRQLLNTYLNGSESCPLRGLVFGLFARGQPERLRCDE